MARLKLTTRFVEGLAVARGAPREEYADALAPGLRLRVTAKAKRWSAIVTDGAGGRRREELGTFPEMTLADARRAAGVAQDAGRGVAPAIGGGGSGAPRPSTETLLEAYCARLERLGRRSAPQVRRALLTGEAGFLAHLRAEGLDALAAAEIAPEHVAGFLRATHARAPAQARAARALLHAAFAFGLTAAHEWRGEAGRDFGLARNPVGATPGGGASAARPVVVPLEAMGALWRLAPRGSGPQMGAALRLVLAMGGLRVREVIESRRAWWQADSSGALWLDLPVTKSGHPHAVPVPELARAPLAAAIEAAGRSDYLFPNERDLARAMTESSPSKAVRRLVADEGLPALQLRDLRRSWKTHLLERELATEGAVDIWMNHGRNADVARRHYDFAERRALKLRVAAAVDALLGEAIGAA